VPSLHDGCTHDARSFLTLAGGAAVGLALPTSGFAQAPPKLQNIVSADEALKL